MNITELDSYSLADAVKFNDQLNPRIWQGQTMRPQVRAKLLEIAADFQQFLGVPDLDVRDITVSGSNAGYTYTDHSDIDLHLVVAMPEQCDEVYQELFNAKKYQYNDEHDIRIGGYDVELYVQPADQPHVSAGVYSVMNNDWIHIPRKLRADVDDAGVKNKYEDVKARVEAAVKSGDIDRMQKLWDKIKDMRRAGLATNGELGPENLAFKILRTQGVIGSLKDAIARERDRELSLTERRKKKKKVRYGFGGYWYPGFAFGTGSDAGSDGAGDGGGEARIQEVGLSPDGVSPETKMFLSEKPAATHEEIIRDFFQYAVEQLGIENIPGLKLKKDPQWSIRNQSFGRYDNDTGNIDLAVGKRHIMDVLRTLAHELMHRKQDERDTMPPGAGETGSPYENEAHVIAGILMRNYADLHPEYFEDVPVEETVDEGWKEKAGAMAAAACIAGTPGCATTDIAAAQTAARTAQTVQGMTRQGVRQELDQELRNYIRAQGGGPGSANAQNLSRIYQLQKRQQQNEATGYIPKNKREAQDPRFMMAITQDIKPGEVGRQANKLALKTDSQGRPGLLMKTANLREGRAYDGNDPLGPETPPTMPRGTLRVDVSDVYDWYKLGQHISNMKGLGRHDFGAGPPSSIISFGDEETEHKFIKDLEATGLDVTDIDPADPEQPPGMRRIKTDPTYNVDEEEDLVESLRQEFELLEDQFLGEIKMSTANLRQEAAKTGALAGMEFEMIVPDAEVEPPEPEYERDEDQDRRARSFDDIEEFFYDGDYNGRGDIRRLREALDEAYQEWKMDQLSDDWSREGLDFMRDYIERYDLFDREEALDTARDEIIDANPDLPPESEEFQQLLNARINELEEQFVQAEFDAQGRAYNDAFEEFTDDKSNDYEESDFLEDSYPYMSDIEQGFDITWPYYYDINDGRGGEANIDKIADDFSDAIGMPVNASSSYHGARREAGKYVVEPDGSLEGDNPGDAGLEFVSPPMPIDQMLNDLDAVKKWAGRRGCYTNDSTGLHINISVPNYSLDKLDYVKLALLMGDEYVLELFGRSGNYYAKAATGKIRDMLRRNPDLAPMVMDKMRGHMEDLATKAIHSGTTDKYTSINTKSGYIEFRSPGGDWLDANFDKIENTLLRFTVALSAAIDPQAYRQEYLKKLYKLLEGSQEKGGVDVVQLFSNYSAGELDKAALIRQVREKQLARNLAKGRTPPGQKYWWKVTNPANTMASIEVVAAGKEEAIAKAVEPNNYPEWARVQNTLRATPLRPYQEPQAPNQTGNWGIWIHSANRFARAPGQSDNSVLRRFPGRDSALQWIEQIRRENPNMRTDIEVREIEPSVQNTGSITSGNWGVWVPSLDRYATIGNAGPRRFENQAGAEAWIQDYNQRHAGSELELQAREIESAPQSGTPLSQTDAERRMDLPDQTGDANWEIIDRRTGRRVFVMIANTEYDARRKYADWLSAAGYPIETEDYGFREIASAQQQDNWSQDFERRMQGSDPGSLIDQGLAASSTFTGNWLIQDPDGRTIHRFGGIGNSQGDANNFAIRWLQQNPQHMQAGVTVVPEMG